MVVSYFMMLLKRGQVTVFIILGILLLGIVGLLLFVVSEVKLGELQVEQERVVTKGFQKEALRVFVEDCLTDSLEEGLEKVGLQGRLWSHDPGGSALHFQEGFTGITFLSNYSLYYAITYQEDLEHPNSYPCAVQQNESPAFCRYAYPKDYPEEAEYGKKGNIGLGNIESDLKSYIINQSAFCVQEFLYSNLSISSNIEEDDIEISKLKIENDGINIHVEYPLELVVEDEVYFHLVDFSFFYPSPQLKNLLQHAVNFPLNKEINNVSYNYSQEDLEKGSSIYRDELSTEIEKFNVSGDTVIRFQLDSGKVLKAQPYIFQFAIENRPPALDYVEREACGNYDYLVISGYGDYMGEINITPTALDPDYDEINYNFTHTGINGIGWKENKHIYSDLGSTVPGMYNITINSSDEHSLGDWQVVRVLIDPEISVDIWLDSPYENFAGGTATISREDPVFLYINISSTDQLVGGSLALYADLMYDSQVTESFVMTVPTSEGLNCIPLPYEVGQTCSLGNLEQNLANFDDDIDVWDEFYLNDINVSPYFNDTTTNGEMNFELEIDYCGLFSQTPEDDLNLNVQECIPWPGIEGHPYPYVPGWFYHNVLVNTSLSDNDPGYVLAIDDEISPFLASHSCCNSDGTLKSLGEECFRSPPDCYGGIPGWTFPTYGGYVLEQVVENCTGERGNVCGDGLLDYKLYDGELKCGSSDFSNCNDIDIACENQLSWSYVELGTGETGWCHGRMGCQDICKGSDNEEVVYVGTDILGRDPVESDIIANALRLKSKEDVETEFVCGCEGYPNRRCDGDFNGIFDGICSAGTCSGG